MTHRAHSCKMPPPDPRLFDVNFKSRPAGALRHCLRKHFVSIWDERNKTIPDASLAWHVFGPVVPGSLARGQSRRAGGPASHSERPRISPDGSGKVPLSRGRINIPAVGRTRSDRNASCLSASEFEKFLCPDRRKEVVPGLRPNRREEVVLGLRRADRRPAVSSQGPLRVIPCGRGRLGLPSLLVSGRGCVPGPQPRPAPHVCVMGAAVAEPGRASGLP